LPLERLSEIIPGFERARMTYEHHHPKQHNKDVISIIPVRVQQRNVLMLSEIYRGVYFTFYAINKRECLLTLKRERGYNLQRVNIVLF
jgi:hypothetical protein